MAFTAADIKTLRDATGAGLLDCKKALADTNGDVAAAEKLLKEKGLASMAKRTDRAAGEGRIVVKQDGNRIAIIEIVSETDFVANNADFIETAEKAAEVTLEKKASGVLEEHKALVEPLLVKFRENISVKRAEYIEVAAGSSASTYVHHDHKIGAVVVVKGSEDEKVKEFAHVCCLHLASNKPEYITKEEVPQSYIDDQTDIFKAQMAEDPSMAKKPDNVKEGILKGKISKALASICFMDQPYLDDEKITVAQAIANTAKANNANISFEKVILYVLGK